MLLSMRLWLGIAAVNGALAVAAGAFGAHALKGQLPPELLTTWETAARYQMYHALAMALAALAGSHENGSNLSPKLFLGGIVLFSGSLYALALGGPLWLGPVTPLGGALLIAGWICLAISSLRKSS
jgi:uncharacterized membrane protein YgdD (TMEM256/DUF423 family)